MTFRRIKSITTGINKVTIIKMNLLLSKNGKEIISITVHHAPEKGWSLGH